MQNNRVLDFKILDCTIRDGGYLNNWQFDKKMVKDLYRNLSKSGIDFIEIGFRNPPKDGAGIWYSASEDLLNDLFSEIQGLPIALMMDYDKADISVIPNKKDSLVKMYRVACHKNKVIETIDFCEEIKGKGYQASIQLMGIAGYSKEDFKVIINPLMQSSVDYVYFADSYGSLLPKEIAEYIYILKPAGKKIGFHSHNSLQLAFANTLEAIRAEVDIVDATVFGMGRGAGNLALETLVSYLEKTYGGKRYNATPILNLIDRYFINLHKEISWGYNLPNMLSGIFGVHPNYTKQLIDYSEYSMEDVVKVLDIVHDSAPVGFDKNIVPEIIQSGFVGILKKDETRKHDEKELKKLKDNYSIEYVDRHKGHDFLILASGPSLKNNKKEIDSFINRYDPIVIGSNFLGGLFSLQYHMFSNKKRFESYVDQVDKKSNLLLSSSFSESFIKNYTERSYEKIVHLDRVSNDFKIRDNIITSNCRTVSMLCIASAIVMGAKRIFIAGMDGYKSKENFLSKNLHFYEENEEANDFKLLMEKHNWNESLLQSINSYLNDCNKEGLHIITPTSHRQFYSDIDNWLGERVRI